VGSIERVKSHDVSHLYILGVNDSVFPAVNNDEGILNDLEREILKNKGMELAKDTREAAFEEQFLVYTTLTIPCNYLKISYPMADFEGKSLRPSIIVSRIKTIFPNIIEENDLMLEETDETIMNLISTKTPTFNELIAVLRKRLDGIDDSLIWRDVYKWFSSNEEWKVKCQKAFSGAVYSNQVKAIKKEKVKKLYEYNSKMNVSRLERYVECPFSYYVQYGLKAKDRKIFKLSYPDIGTFLHKIIDEFSNKVKEDKLSWDELSPNWCENAIEAIVESNINSEGSYILKSSARYEYLTGRLKKVLTKTALVITNHIKTSGFKPIGYEIDFGNVDGYPPIVVELSSGEKINLIGRIDRIDMLIKDSNTYIRIIDYKSGNKIFKLSEVYYGLQVQLLLYLDAILSQNKDNLPAAVLYFKIDNPLIKTNNDLTDEALEEEIMKKFKMKGLLIDDVEIIKEMDKEMDGNSYIIPARINKDGTLGKSDAASIYQFELLRKHVKKIIAENCEKLISGDISISPCKNGDSIPCEYCSYSSICTFEEELLDNSYRQIYEKSDDEVWQLLNKEYGHDLVGEK
jgi:ATP-dependent helicase/nuclease subunit B